MRRPPFTATNSRRGTRERGVPRLRKCFVFYIRLHQESSNRVLENQLLVTVLRELGIRSIRIDSRCKLRKIKNQKSFVFREIYIYIYIFNIRNERCKANDEFKCLPFPLPDYVTDCLSFLADMHRQ